MRIYCRPPSVVVLVACLIFGCSSLPPATSFDAGVPTVIFSALCEAFFNYEDYDASTPTVVLRVTRPLYQTFALRILHEVDAMTPAEAERDYARDEVLRTLFRETRLEMPENDGRCRWVPPEGRDEDYFGTDAIILELSNITENPFAAEAQPRFGVFARLSSGGAFGASWYWVPLERAGGAWSAPRAYELAISDG